MMDRGASSNDVSLAFVDIITNGLGGMLVLFFLVVLLQTQLEWHDDPAVGRDLPRQKADPFVIVVRVESGSLDPATNPWQFANVPAGDIPLDRGRTFDWQPRHAILVLNRPPAIGAKIMLASATEPLELDVAVYHGDNNSRRWRQAVPPTTKASIWPAPRTANGGP